MRLETIVANCHWLNTDYGSILFSYDSPVACFTNSTNAYYVSKKFEYRSGTTGKHINHFTGKLHTVIPDEQFQAKLREALVG